MTTNLSSRNVRLIIGSQDWSAWIEADSGIQVGYPEYQVGSGLKPCEGTITLEFSEYDTNLKSNPNYLLNPTQWQREQTLSIEAVNDSGVLQYLPCSGQLLYILKSPQRPKRSLDGLQQITLQIGCRLALEYFPPEPNKDVSGVVAGTPLDRGQIISNILSFIGVPSAIGGLPYPIDYPLPKIEGNWIQMCGELASTAGYYLRCNQSGVVIAEPTNLAALAPIRDYVIGEDEEFWEPSGDSTEQPVESLTISGVRLVVNAVDTDPQVEIFREPLSKTYPDIFGQNSSFNPSEALVSRKINSFEKINDDLFQSKETIEEALAKAYPDIFGQNSGFNNRQSKVSETRTKYFLSKGICYKTVFEEYEALAKTYPDIFGQNSGFNNSIALKRITTKTWAKVRDGLWNLTIRVAEARSLTYPDIFAQNSGFSNSLLKYSENTKPDTSGPPTNFGDLGANTIKEEPIKAEVFSQQLSASINRDRQNTIKLPYAVEVSQLQKYGENFNAFLSGRSLGFLFSGKFDFLTPFNQVSVIDGDIVYYMRVDGLQWSINLLKVSLSWYGIVNGFASIETPEDIVKPVEISLGEFVFETKFNLYGVFEEPLASQAITQFNIYAIPSIAWGNLDTQFDLYAINDAVISMYKAYWAFEDIFSNFAVNELGNTDYDLDLSSSSSASVATGKVNNTIRDFSATLSESLSDPFWDLNINNFVGFALWIYPESSGSGQRKVLRNGSIFEGSTPDSWRLTVDFDTSQVTLTSFVFGDGSYDISGAITIDDWNLAICEVDKAAETFSIKINNGTKISGSHPFTGNENPLPIFVRGNESIIIDELLFFSEPLNSTQEADIWASGSGSAYPPF